MSGESSLGYARRFNPNLFEIVCEVPYYYDERICNLRQTKSVRRNLVLENLEFQKKDMDTLKEIYEKIKSHIDTHTKFQDALEYFMKSFEKAFEAEKKWAETAEELSRNATVAERFDNEIASRSYSLFKWGMLYRLVKKPERIQERSHSETSSRADQEFDRFSYQETREKDQVQSHTSEETCSDSAHGGALRESVQVTEELKRSPPKGGLFQFVSITIHLPLTILTPR